MSRVALCTRLAIGYRREVHMPIEKWSDQVNVVRLLDDPQFTDDLQLLEEQIEKKAASTVLDFSQVSYINSSNISRLLRLRKQVTSADLKLILCGIITS